MRTKMALSTLYVGIWKISVISCLEWCNKTEPLTLKSPNFYKRLKHNTSNLVIKRSQGLWFTTIETYPCYLTVWKNYDHMREPWKSGVMFYTSVMGLRTLTIRNRSLDYSNVGKSKDGGRVGILNVHHSTNWC